MPYYVYDLKERTRVGKAIQNKNRARTSAERRNQIYGAHRYVAVNENGHQVAYSAEDAKLRGLI